MATACPIDDNKYLLHLFSDEQERVQKKTFVNWINSYLGKRVPPLRIQGGVRTETSLAIEFQLALQGISMRPFSGLVNFVPAVAYHVCLNLPSPFSQPGNGLIEIPCTFSQMKMEDEFGSASLYTELG